MQPGFEVRYLNIDWLAEGAPRKVDAAPTPLVLEPSPEGGFEAESTIFKDDYPWVGIRLLESHSSLELLLLAGSGERKPLMSVRDPVAGAIWWINVDGWDGKNRSHYSELRRSAGNYRIRIGSVELLIKNRLSEYGRADVQGYVDDFRGSLLWMILNDEASATARGSGGASGTDVVALMEGLYDASRRVLVAPATTVREGRELTSVAKVRAVATTFREFAQNPRARQLTGRVFSKSVDTPENRYLRYMLALTVDWAGAWLMGAISQLEPLENLADAEAKRAEHSGKLKERAVDPEMFDKQTKETVLRLSSLQDWNGRPLGQVGSGGRFQIRLGRRYRDDSAFFYERVQDTGESSGPEVDYRVVVLPETAFELVQRTLHFCREFTFEGQARSSINESKSGKKYLELDLSELWAAVPHTNVVEQRAERRRRLEKKGWMVDLSQQELKELRREASIAVRRAKRARAKREEIEVAVMALAGMQGRLAEVESGLAALGISRSDKFPTGMLFVSNPAYAACISAFKKAEAAFRAMGLDASLLEGLETIGILHASDIYEKWCLLKICMILVEDFLFTAEHEWVQKMIRSSLSGDRNVEFVFVREDIGIQLVVTYQHETELGYRPDFVVRIQDVQKKSRRGLEFLGGLVLDAKFRSAWHKFGLREVLDELIVKKGYGNVGEVQNVFVLQPCTNTVVPTASPLGWGRHCDYGATQSHRKGWIQVGATAPGATHTEHLKRLLGMALQRALPGPQDEKEGAPRSFCLGCGEAHRSEKIRSKPTKGGGTSWLLDCGDCGVWTVRTHCYECKSPLFKNGTQWTYHETLADQVTNVICPECGSYFDASFNRGD